MKVQLIFTDWKKDNKSVYNTEEGNNLGMGPFHSGTTFNAEIELSEGNAEELKQAIKNGYVPVWDTMLRD